MTEEIKMSGTAVARMKVNGFSMDWSDDTKRKARPCIECGQPTFGRTDIPDCTKKRGVRVEIACVGCAMKRAMREGLGR
jgi:hypothetical protein